MILIWFVSGSNFYHFAAAFAVTTSPSRPDLALVEYSPKTVNDYPDLQIDGKFV